MRIYFAIDVNKFEFICTLLASYMQLTEKIVRL